MIGRISGLVKQLFCLQLRNCAGNAQATNHSSGPKVGHSHRKPQEMAATNRAFSVVNSAQNRERINASREAEQAEPSITRYFSPSVQ